MQGVSMKLLGVQAEYCLVVQGVERMLAERARARNYYFCENKGEVADRELPS
jgi:hypothetical protein